MTGGGYISSRRLAEELWQGRPIQESTACYAARQQAKEWLIGRGLALPFWLRPGYEGYTKEVRVPIREKK